MFPVRMRFSATQKIGSGINYLSFDASADNDCLSSRFSYTVHIARIHHSILLCAALVDARSLFYQSVVFLRYNAGSG